MGTYIQIGVCIELRVARNDITRMKLSRDDVTRTISASLVDLSLYAPKDDETWIRWVLPPTLVEQGLLPFLRDQFALATMHDDKGYGASTLRKIEKAGSYPRLLALARDRTLVDFQSSSLEEYLPRDDRPPVRAEVLDYLIEGRAVMECNARLFHYIRNLIRCKQPEHPIAGAVVVFLG